MAPSILKVSFGQLRGYLPPTIAYSTRWLWLTSILTSYIIWTVTRNLIQNRIASEKARQMISLAGESKITNEDKSTTTLALGDGRLLGFAQYGTRAGRPIFYLHGLPGACIEAASFHDSAIKVGVRIIAIDRPGYGLSSPQPDRTMLDLAKDIDALAEHLDLVEYGLMGISAGGSYVLPCAYSLSPNKLKAVAIMCGMGTPDMPKTGMGWQNKFGFTYGYKYFPFLARWYFHMDGSTRLELSDEERLQSLMQRFQKNSKSIHPKDKSVFGDVNKMRRWIRTSRQAFAQDLRDSIYVDGRLVSMDPGFRIEDIRKDLPVHLWYGMHDIYVPLCHGEHFASRLGEQATLRVLDETHASLSSPENVANLLRRLLESM